MHYAYWHRRAALRRVVAAAGFVLLATGVHAADKTLPLPRFVSLRSDEVNMRTGPGERYPIEWVFNRKGLPVELLAEFDVWRKIRDSQGTTGWVHQRMLASSRSVVIKGGDLHALHGGPDAAAPAVAKAEPGVVAKLIECKGDWCRIEAQGIKGWLQRGEFWGVYPDEIVE